MMANSKNSNKLDGWEKIIENRSERYQEDDSTKEKRSSSSNSGTNERTEYERDFDRLIFSSAFKRLQDKTQVFPLPGTKQVHNRLTHSLEVASVGRSLGSMVGSRLAKKLEKNNFSKQVVDFYRYELKDVVLAACLAHDLGNPCFGHSGEAIISNYFENLKKLCSGKKNELPENLKELQQISDPEWIDLTHFEGNANTLRMLTTHYHGKLAGGLRLTYLTLGTILKYPWESGHYHKKYSFFQEQKELVRDIAEKLYLTKNSSKQDNLLVFNRHPFVYLVEAADDICYLIMDVEDAHKINIFSSSEVEKLFMNLLKGIQKKVIDKYSSSLVLESLRLSDMQNKIKQIKDDREKIVYLRSKCINALTHLMAEIFMQNAFQILSGNWKYKELKDCLIEEYKITELQEIIDLSKQKIYKHHTVSEAVVGASKVLPELLDLFIPSILKQKHRTFQQEKLFLLINSQYTDKNIDSFIKNKTVYQRILSLLDFLTGMTDDYILELYRKLIGIDMPKH